MASSNNSKVISHASMHTQKKFELIEKYIMPWAQKLMNNPSCHGLVFIKCTVLTKGILPAELAHASRDNEYGITLVTLDEEYRTQMEPGAAPLQLRLDALRALHEAGCKTWVSIEPYPTPNLIEQDLHKLLEAVGFADQWYAEHHHDV